MSGTMRCPIAATNKLLLVAAILVFSFTVGDCYTEAFSITTHGNEASYYAGNIDSNFFMAKRSSGCSFEWTSSAGSATGDDDNNENREIFYGSIVGSDGLIYAAGTTKGNFSSPEDEVPTLDAAVVVYEPSNGSLVRQAQFDVYNGLDNVVGAIVQKPDGALLVAVYCSPPNTQNIALYSTRVLEISPDSLELLGSHDVEVLTTGAFAFIFGGPTILDMIYDESQNAVVAVGQILGRGLLFMFSLSTSSVVAQTEWGSILANMQIGGLATDDNGAFYVTGSSSENIRENGDLQTVVASELHAYVIRYDNVLLAEPELRWVRQLAGSGSSQSGDDISLDPTSGAVVVIGSFHADFAVTDEHSGRTFELRTITSDGLTDIFVWYLDAENGTFTDL
ncbi:Quinoprotein amine dehydrogenase beta chain-like protein [Gracilaria domingensis]|nr:Quinoprotein amine dehydrogenase beta chain-like protein [Gracilaria domingensis]